MQGTGSVLAPPIRNAFGAAIALMTGLMSAGLGGDALSVQSAKAMEPVIAATRVVGSVAELQQALREAHSGDTIAVRPGVYTGVVISRLTFDEQKPVVVTSLDPARPATFVGIGVGLITGLRVSHVELTAVGVKDPYYAFRMDNCHGVSLDHIDAHGDPNIPPGLQTSGFYVKYSTNFSISDSHVHDLNAAIVVGANDGLTIQRNLLTRLNKGGIEMGGGSSVTITDNIFTEFILDPGTHPDAVQLFTAGTKTPSRDVIISKNLFYRGKGSAIQGLFVKDEVGTLPYERLTISDNAVIGGTYHGIYVVGAADDLVVKNNVVASWPGLDYEGMGRGETKLPAAKTVDYHSWIFIGGDLTRARVAETGNFAQAYTGSPEFKGQPSGNRMLGKVTDEGRALIRAWSDAEGRPPPTL
jgi:hypothetical protein